MKTVPPELFEEKKREGKNPFELCCPGEMVDFGEDYNAKRNVEEI